MGYDGSAAWLLGLLVARCILMRGRDTGEPISRPSSGIVGAARWWAIGVLRHKGADGQSLRNQGRRIARRWGRKAKGFLKDTVREFNRGWGSRRWAKRAEKVVGARCEGAEAQVDGTQRQAMGGEVVTMGRGMARATGCEGAKVGKKHDGGVEKVWKRRGGMEGDKQVGESRIKVKKEGSLNFPGAAAVVRGVLALSALHWPALPSPSLY